MRFNTQPPEGGWSVQTVWLCPVRGFNTQPPEGGWLKTDFVFRAQCLFQHAAARRRLVRVMSGIHRLSMFQHAAARRRLALLDKGGAISAHVSTRSRPKAAGFLKALYRCYKCVSTRSRPKAAGVYSRQPFRYKKSFNTQPPEGGWRLVRRRQM